MSTPSSINLEEWEKDVLVAIVEQDYQRLSRETFITKPQAWKRARYANLRADVLADADVRFQLADWHDRLMGPPGRRGTYAQRAEISRLLHDEWNNTPNAQAYNRPEGEDLERLIDRCVYERYGAAATRQPENTPKPRVLAPGEPE